MGRYLDIARKVSEKRTPLPVGEDATPNRGCEVSEISEKPPEHWRLLASGWTPKVRGGKTIWVSPQTGFWYGEEVALELLRLDEGPEWGGAI